MEDMLEYRYDSRLKLKPTRLPPTHSTVALILASTDFSLRTPRLILRPFLAEDIEDGLGYRDDEEFARFLPHIPQPFGADTGTPRCIPPRRAA